MRFLRKPGSKFRDLSPKAIREIIVIAVILIIALALSIPQYLRDVEAAKQQKAELQAGESFFRAERPEAQGMDSVRLDLAAEQLQSTSALSFLVVRNGSAVYEKYFDRYGSSVKSRNNVYSITKSFLSALMGIAIREGYIGGVEETVEKYFPDYSEELADPRWKKITLKHLLTMTPGFCENLNALNSSEDWIRYTFNLPLEYDPGEEFQYANSASHLLSVILTRATGMSTKDFADKYLLGPLDIPSPQWQMAPGEYYVGYAGIYLSPRDLAKFGWLYYSKGEWEGKQIVPEEWVAESTKLQFDLNEGKDAGYENGYGYKWWIGGKTGHPAFSALGHGGQSITVIPDLGLVVVITCMPDTLSLSDAQRDQLLKDYVIAAITEKDGGK